MNGESSGDTSRPRIHTGGAADIDEVPRTDSAVHIDEAPSTDGAAHTHGTAHTDDPPRTDRPPHIDGAPHTDDPPHTDGLPHPAGELRSHDDPTEHAARLGLRTVRTLVEVDGEVPDGGSAADFLLRRWAGEVERLGSDREEAGAMGRAIHPLRSWASGEGPARNAAASLVSWSAAAESRSRLSRASELLTLAARLLPEDAGLALRRGRVARKRGRTEDARAHYDRVGEFSESDSPLTRLADLGRALLADDPEAALGRVLREAVRAGDDETAGIALEERAGKRRSAGDPDGAVRDYGAAAIRFCDPVDRGRVLHAAADTLLAAGSLMAARDVLLAARSAGHPRQAGRADARLHGLATQMGDELGRRRWRASASPDLVSLGPAQARHPSRDASPGRAARHVDRLRRKWAPAGL